MTDPKALAEVAQIIVDACVGACTLEDLALISPEEYADVMKAAMRITALRAPSAEAMRERAAAYHDKIAQRHEGWGEMALANAHHKHAAAIRALPLTPESAS